MGSALEERWVATGDGRYVLRADAKPRLDRISSTERAYFEALFALSLSLVHGLDPQAQEKPKQDKWARTASLVISMFSSLVHFHSAGSSRTSPAKMDGSGENPLLEDSAQGGTSAVVPTDRVQDGAHATTDPHSVDRDT